VDLNETYDYMVVAAGIALLISDVKHNSNCEKAYSTTHVRTFLLCVQFCLDTFTSEKGKDWILRFLEFCIHIGF
jgi:hypothetical protein